LVFRGVRRKNKKIKKLKCLGRGRGWCVPVGIGET
jgi:hypothetical protein